MIAISVTGCGKFTLNGGKFPETVTVENVTASTAEELRNYQQTDDPWGSHGLGGSANIWCTGCGIVSVCNAVHYATGYFIDPAELADWANENDFGYGYNWTEGKELYYHVGETFGDSLGFEIPETGSYEDNGLPSVRLHITSSNEQTMKEKMISLIDGGATLVAHVKNHFISINDYDFSTDRFLVWDNAAGTLPDGGPGHGGHRLWITHTDGDWFRFEDFRGTKANGSGSFEYFNVDYVIPIIPLEGVQLFHVERDEILVSGVKRQETGKACDFTQIDCAGGGTEIVFKGSYSSKKTPNAIGFRIDGGKTVYKSGFFTKPSVDAKNAGSKWCGEGAFCRGFEIKLEAPDESAHTYEIVVKTGGIERVIWTAIAG